jgi:hypothetical protein
VRRRACVRVGCMLRLRIEFLLRDLWVLRDLRVEKGQSQHAPDLAG